MMTRIPGDSPQYPSVRCDEIAGQLADYLERRERGLPQADEDGVIASHLQQCSDCTLLLDEMNAIVEASRKGEIPQSSAYPTPDLSFLPPRQASTQPPWRITDIGHLIISFSAELLPSLRAPQLRTVTRGQLLYRYTLERSALADLTATVDVVEATGDLDQVDLIVNVHAQWRPAFGQQGTRVVVHGLSPIREGVTNAVGRVVFPGVSRDNVPALEFEIIPPPT